MPANPLQELAEKIAAELYTSYGYRQEATDKILPILTASVGTLLQAERAAMVELALTAFNKEFCQAQRSGVDTIGSVKCGLGEVKALAMPEAASALAAVVQRETEKLKALLREAYEEFEVLYGHHCSEDGKTCCWCGKDVFTDNRHDDADECPESPYKQMLDKLEAAK